MLIRKTVIEEERKENISVLGFSFNRTFEIYVYTIRQISRKIIIKIIINLRARSYPIDRRTIHNMDFNSINQFL